MKMFGAIVIVKCY